LFETKAMLTVGSKLMQELNSDLFQKLTNKDSSLQIPKDFSRESSAPDASTRHFENENSQYFNSMVHDQPETSSHQQQDMFSRDSNEHTDKENNKKAMKVLTRHATTINRKAIELEKNNASLNAKRISDLGCGSVSPPSDSDDKYKVNTIKLTQDPINLTVKASKQLQSLCLLSMTKCLEISPCTVFETKQMLSNEAKMVSKFNCTFHASNTLADKLQDHSLIKDKTYHHIPVAASCSSLKKSTLKSKDISLSKPFAIDNNKEREVLVQHLSYSTTENEKECNNLEEIKDIKQENPSFKCASKKCQKTEQNSANKILNPILNNIGCTEKKSSESSLVKCGKRTKEEVDYVPCSLFQSKKMLHTEAKQICTDSRTELPSQQSKMEIKVPKFKETRNSFQQHSSNHTCVKVMLGKKKGGLCKFFYNGKCRNKRCLFLHEIPPEFGIKICPCNKKTCQNCKDGFPKLCKAFMMAKTTLNSSCQACHEMEKQRKRKNIAESDGSNSKRSKKITSHKVSQDQREDTLKINVLGSEKIIKELNQERAISKECINQVPKSDEVVACSLFRSKKVLHFEAKFLKDHSGTNNDKLSSESLEDVLSKSKGTDAASKEECNKDPNAEIIANHTCMKVVLGNKKARLCRYFHVSKCSNQSCPFVHEIPPEFERLACFCKKTSCTFCKEGFPRLWRVFNNINAKLNSSCKACNDFSVNCNDVNVIANGDSNCKENERLEHPQKIDDRENKIFMTASNDEQKIGTENGLPKKEMPPKEYVHDESFNTVIITTHPINNKSTETGLFSNSNEAQHSKEKPEKGLSSKKGTELEEKKLDMQHLYERSVEQWKKRESKTSIEKLRKRERIKRYQRTSAPNSQVPLLHTCATSILGNKKQELCKFFHQTKCTRKHCTYVHEIPLEFEIKTCTCREQTCRHCSSGFAKLSQVFQNVKTRLNESCNGCQCNNQIRKRKKNESDALREIKISKLAAPISANEHFETLSASNTEINEDVQPFQNSRTVLSDSLDIFDDDEDTSEICGSQFAVILKTGQGIWGRTLITCEIESHENLVGKIVDIIQEPSTRRSVRLLNNTAGFLIMNDNSLILELEGDAYFPAGSIIAIAMNLRRFVKT
jgi:hypothetical protein